MKAEKQLYKTKTVNQWESDRIATRRSLDMALNLCPWSSRAGVSLLGVPRHLGRVIEVIDTSYWKYFKKYGDVAEWGSDAWVHISQNGNRTPISFGLPCLVANSVVYNFGADRILSGHGNLQTFGWPSDRIPRAVLSDSEARDIAGNSFSIPIAGLIQMACIANPYGPWWCSLKCK